MNFFLHPGWTLGTYAWYTHAIKWRHFMACVYQVMEEVLPINSIVKLFIAVNESDLGAAASHMVYQPPSVIFNS